MRPHRTLKAAELESLVEAHWSSISGLKSVAHELVFRNSAGARELKTKVSQRLEELQGARVQDPDLRIELPKAWRESALIHRLMGSSSLKTSLQKEGSEAEPPSGSRLKCNQGLSYVFQLRHIETPAFFAVVPKGGQIEVTINAKHPILGVLMSSQDQSVCSEDRMAKECCLEPLAAILLAAWARLEHEQPTTKLQRTVRDLRLDWGRVLGRFVERTE